MPWSAKQARSKTHKANTPAKQSKWASIANGVLKQTGNESKAVRIANAAVDARFWDGDTFLAEQFDEHARTIFKDWGKKIKSRAADRETECPDCDGTGREDGEVCSTCDGTGRVDKSAEMNSDSLVNLYPTITDSSRPHTSTVRMYDRIEIDDAAKVRTLENGYVAAYPRIARTGIQVYRGSECGRNDMETVRVLRPEVEVFHNDAVHSYTHLPLTLDHPTVQVDSTNWKKYAVGETGDEVLRDGGAVRVPMMLRDAQAIKAFRAGANQLSVGYDCDLEWADGVTEDGEEYDAIQHGIRANHLAVVAAARGGSTLAIGDSTIDDHQGSKGVDTMNLKTILVDGLEVQVMDSAATVIQRTISSLENQLRDMKDKFKKKEDDDDDKEEEAQQKDAALKAKDEAIKAKDKDLETKSGEIAALKVQLTDAEKKSSPQAIDSAARERASVIDKANTVMGARLKTDGMTVPDIRRAVVEARVGSCKDWSDDRVEGAFDAMQTNAFAQQDRRNPASTVEDAVRVFGRPGTGYQSPSDMRDKAYADYDSDISGAWRGKQSA